MFLAADKLLHVYALSEQHDILTCQLTEMKQVADDLWHAQSRLLSPLTAEAKIYHERHLQSVYLTSPTELAPAQTGIFACLHSAKAEAALRMGSEIALTLARLAQLKAKQHALLSMSSTPS